MKTLAFLTRFTLIAVIGGLITVAAPCDATAKPLSKESYLIFDASIRNRDKGEKRFRRVLQLVYGNRERLREFFGEAGPAPKVQLSLKGKAGSITFKSTANQNIALLDFNSKARVGKDVLVLLVNNAICQIEEDAPETCQAEIRVIKGRLFNRIIASGSNGAASDSGSADVSGNGSVVVY